MFMVLNMAALFIYMFMAALFVCSNAAKSSIIITRGGRQQISLNNQNLTSNYSIICLQKSQKTRETTTSFPQKPDMITSDKVGPRPSSLSPEIPKKQCMLVLHFLSISTNYLKSLTKI